MMNAYFALFTARARLLLQYRTAALAGLATQLFWGVMRIMVFTAFYHSVSLTAHIPFNLKETITYIWMSQALLALLPWNLDREMEQVIRTGNVIYDLVKPIQLYWYWFSRAAAMRLIPASLRGLPVAILAGLFFDFPAPASLASAAAFMISLAGALALSTAITTLVMISLFWTITGEGLTRLLPPVVLILTGVMIPLPLFPDWAQPILNFLPFRGIIDTPVRLYSGYVLPGDAWSLFLHQWIWATGLVVGGYRLMARATKRLVVHGG